MAYLSQLEQFEIYKEKAISMKSGCGEQHCPDKYLCAPEKNADCLSNPRRFNELGLGR